MPRSQYLREAPFVGYRAAFIHQQVEQLVNGAVQNYNPGRAAPCPKPLHAAHPRVGDVASRLRTSVRRGNAMTATESKRHDRDNITPPLGVSWDGKPPGRPFLARWASKSGLSASEPFTVMAAWPELATGVAGFVKDLSPLC